MFSALFWSLSFILSITMLTVKNLKTAILFFGLYGTMTSGAYMFMGAPDVSFASLALGAGFTTFVFLIAIRKTGKVIVGYKDTAYLIFKGMHGELTGFEYEILSGFLKEESLEVEFVELCDDEEFTALHKKCDIFIGGIIPENKPYLKNDKWIKKDVLETRVFLDPNGLPIDLVRMKEKIINHEAEADDFKYINDAHYLFLFEHHRPEMALDFEKYLNNLIKTNKLEEIVRRHIG